MDYLAQSRNCQFEPPNQSAPTQARPGSAQKLQVMAERFRSGQPLHHPNDETSVGKAMSAFLAWARQKDNAETSEQEHQLLTLRDSVGNGSDEIEFTGGPYDGHKKLLGTACPAEELAWIVCEDLFRLRSRTLTRMNNSRSTRPGTRH